ncbi:putative transposase/invertase (TIGR01784 family) [Alicyclobacillus sacchari]|uniref:Putative transposase/invertase (TIGR01784 family) n=1 Tax=Alicyclobacillus sacchari TaxID=392010 RepID=A0A4R8LEA9_9BACL|nr:transposase [Alicyclobacillus sacchari]TDY40479.1 putative transposase/invertase (TIGR01784 family) [Alicyclobacillus sacchari]
MTDLLRELEREFEEKGIQKGLQQGLLEGKREVAHRMLVKGASVQDVVELTGLDIKVVEEIRQNLH